MTMFEDRERAFEAKWAHDEEMQFRILARRNELLGRWAASELGLGGDDADRYVADLVALALKNRAIDALFLKLKADLGPGYGDAAILKQMDECLEAAVSDAGLEQRPALGDAKADAQGSGESARKVDFSQLLSNRNSAASDRDGGTHARMLRKVSMRSPD
jgi:hypothetical protein